EAPVLAEVTPDSPAGAAGFRTEDQIIEADGTAVPTWNALYDWIEKRVIRNGTVVFTVLREGKQVPVSVEASAFATTRSFGWRPQLPAVVGTFSAGSAAREAGLVHGDRILSIDGAPIPRWEDLTRFIQEGRGQPQEFEVRRGAEVLRLKVSARKAAGEDRWLIGVSPATYAEKHGLAQSIALGSQRLWDLTVGTFSFIGHALSGKASLDAVGGPVKIGVVIGEAARHGLSDLLFLMAVISLQLGIFNLLPIPALDGGHITLLGAEALKRSPLSAKVRERTQMIGFSLLILLILTVTYNDVISLLG
ncbi:MAG: RIP metalloprotease RseP, partial [Deltaproteobacteria bacterium]|nr:RIP metalloprotease RseP [Deltaproteobacteria bacterium]